MGNNGCPCFWESLLNGLNRRRMAVGMWHKPRLISKHRKDGVDGWMNTSMMSSCRVRGCVCVCLCGMLLLSLSNLFVPYTHAYTHTHTHIALQAEGGTVDLHLGKRLDSGSAIFQAAMARYNSVCGAELNVSPVDCYHPTCQRDGLVRSFTYPPDLYV